VVDTSIGVRAPGSVSTAVVVTAGTDADGWGVGDGVGSDGAGAGLIRAGRGGCDRRSPPPPPPPPEPASGMNTIDGGTARLGSEIFDTRVAKSSSSAKRTACAVIDALVLPHHRPSTCGRVVMGIRRSDPLVGRVYHKTWLCIPFTRRLRFL
jgi:hypothetical protein